MARVPRSTRRTLLRVLAGAAAMAAADRAAGAPAATVVMTPAAVLEHGEFTLTLTITNPGAEAFDDVSAVLSPGGTGRAVVLFAPAMPLDIAANTSVALVWGLRAEGAGPVRYDVSASGGVPAGPLTVSAAAAGTILPKTDGVTVFPVPATGGSLRVALLLPRGADEVVIEAFNGALERAYRGVWTSLAPGRPEVEIAGLRDWSPGVYFLKCRARIGDGEHVTFPLTRAVIAR